MDLRAWSDVVGTIMINHQSVGYFLTLKYVVVEIKLCVFYNSFSNEMSMIQ